MPGISECTRRRPRPTHASSKFKSSQHPAEAAAATMPNAAKPRGVIDNCFTIIRFPRYPGVLSVIDNKKNIRLGAHAHYTYRLANDIRIFRSLTRYIFNRSLLTFFSNFTLRGDYNHRWHSEGSRGRNRSS